jgi:geranylgeranyl pyrophosphate synthase
MGEVLNPSFAIKKVREEAGIYVNRASGFLKDLPPSSYKDELISLNEFMSSRSY